MKIQLLRDEEITQVVGGGGVLVTLAQNDLDRAPDHLTVTSLRATGVGTLVDRDIGRFDLVIGPDPKDPPNAT